MQRPQSGSEKALLSHSKRFARFITVVVSFHKPEIAVVNYQTLTRFRFVVTMRTNFLVWRLYSQDTAWRGLKHGD